MKKLLSFVLAGTMLVSCADYDDRFDSLNAALEQLEAENSALEAQVAAMQGASAQAAQATAAKLAEFQAAVGGIVVAPTKFRNCKPSNYCTSFSSYCTNCSSS